MGASFLITLREGLEIALVLAILIAYLVRTGRGSEVGAVWRGSGIAAALCTVVGLGIHMATGGLHGSAEKSVEMVIALAAASVLTWMIFWMRANARTMGAELRQQVDSATTAKALMVIAFVAVVREGLETALFLLSAETSGASGASVVFGGLAGLAVAAILGRLVYAGGNKINLRTFFNITGVLLLLFAAGLFGKAVHEFRELLEIESGWIWEPAWTVTSGIWAKGTFYDFVKGFFGWHAETERVRLFAYFAYLIPVGYLYLRKDRLAAPVAGQDERTSVTTP
jgi:high-affinity iron transporter